MKLFFKQLNYSKIILNCLTVIQFIPSQIISTVFKIEGKQTERLRKQKRDIRKWDMTNIAPATTVGPFVETRLLLDDEPIRVKGYMQTVWTIP